MGDKFNLFMVEEPNSEGPDPRGGPRVSFCILRKEVSDPGQTTLWQYVIALLLFLLTIGSLVELGISSRISRLPPEVVKYFTDPNAVEPPDMQLLFPFVDSALPLAYGVLGVQLFHGIQVHSSRSKGKSRYFIGWAICRSCIVFLYVHCWPEAFIKSGHGWRFGAGSQHAFSRLFTSWAYQQRLLGYTSMHATTISIHPLVIAGWFGLTTSAFNLLPVGCLDGGRAMQGAFGKSALVSGLATYTMLGLGVRAPEKPCLNDVTEVGSRNLAKNDSYRGYCACSHDTPTSVGRASGRAGCRSRNHAFIVLKI